MLALVRGIDRVHSSGALSDRSGVTLERGLHPVVMTIAKLEPVRTTDLAAALALKTSTISRHLARLEQLGLVQRTADPADARASLLTLSDDRPPHARRADRRVGGDPRRAAGARRQRGRRRAGPPARQSHAGASSCCRSPATPTSGPGYERRATGRDGRGRLLRSRRARVGADDRRGAASAARRRRWAAPPSAAGAWPNAIRAAAPTPTWTSSVPTRRCSGLGRRTQRSTRRARHALSGLPESTCCWKSRSPRRSPAPSVCSNAPRPPG